MKASRVVAVIIVLAAVGWIASGMLAREPHKVADAAAPPAAEARPRFKVAVMTVTEEERARKVTVSGRTEADKRGTAVARVAGIIKELRVKRGSEVKTGDVIAVLLDEGRSAAVDQARAKLAQRRIELEAKLKLIESGAYAALNKPQLEAELKAATASLALAEAEQGKNEVLAPITGVVSDVPVQVGQALALNATLAEMVSLNPMLAVVEVSERQLGGVSVGDEARVKLVTGASGKGRIRFISPTASKGTRTYRVEIELYKSKGVVPDGVTCEAALWLAKVPAVAVPRSALTFSAEGRLGLRTVQDGNKVAFLPIEVVEDTPADIWVAGVAGGSKVIVRGQDFVKEGEVVEPVAAGAQQI